MIKNSLKNISKVINSGLTPLRSNSDYWIDGNIPWVKTEQLGVKYIYDSNEKITKNALENTSIKLNPANTLSIAMYGEGKTRGSVSILKNETTTNQACCNIVIDEEKADFEFVYYNLKTQYKNLRNLSSGVRKNLNSNDIKNFEIYLPNLDSQKKIAKILSDLDAKIEINNKINQELEAMAKTLYDYWFVQFDFPDKNEKPYKSSGGKMVFNEELRREIPEGWDDGTIGEIADLIRGVSYSKKDIKTERDEGVIPILRATNITKNVVDLENMVYVDSEFASSKQVLNKFDILITMSSGSKDHIGKNGFYYFDKKVAFGAFCAKLVAKNNYRYYLYSYTQSDFMFATIKNESLGTNINNLNNSLVNGFNLVKPPNNILDDFNSKLKTIYHSISNNLKQNQKLSELRDWLLPMLMNGQVSVGYAEQEVESLGLVAEGREEYKKE
tara:strand:- start:14319 stop:15644 length:1326 start_codon:yes stop_codon:yes gene_type:complete